MNFNLCPFFLPQSVRSALQEADNWTTLSAEIEEALDGGDLAAIAGKLSGIQGSLKILSHVPDYDDRVSIILQVATFFNTVLGT